MRLGVQSRPVIVVLCGAAAGAVIIGALAMFFRRRRRKRGSLYTDIIVEPVNLDISRSTTTSANSKNKNISNNKRQFLSSSPYNDRLPDEDLRELSFISSPGNRTIKRSDSFSSDKSDLNSMITVVPFSPSLPLNPVQLLESGMDLMMKARSRWELALRQLEDEEVMLDSENTHLKQQLTQLIELAERIKGNCSDELLNQLCADVAADTVLAEMKRDYEAGKRKQRMDESFSDDESFYSTVETLDFSNLEEHLEVFQHLFLYEEGLRELQEGNIQYRILRTHQMNCSSDSEFLAKLYCIRLAFDEILSFEDNRVWFIENGREIVSQLLTHSNKGPEHFQSAYDSMMEYLAVPDNWISIRAELLDRDVKCMSFYDILIDFLLFDAFDDLDSAPPTLVSAINNKWVSNSFKQVAVLTFVWGALKAKKAMLKIQDGFMSRFYTISEYTSPVLGWGFLGPDGPNKNMCLYFKAEIMDFMRRIFSFEGVRYTTSEELAQDILALAKERVQRIIQKMSVDPALWP